VTLHSVDGFHGTLWEQDGGPVSRAGISRARSGRQLVQHARTLRRELTTDVNEQNHAARRFYEGCGLVVEGRSELDDTGRPYPLLHMRLRNDRRSHGR
jgi:RimJ/RimL family protein N-acetyltransferase